MGQSWRRPLARPHISCKTRKERFLGLLSRVGSSCGAGRLPPWSSGSVLARSRPLPVPGLPFTHASDLLLEGLHRGDGLVAAVERPPAAHPRATQDLSGV